MHSNKKRLPNALSVHLEISVERGGDAATLINRVRGYAAFATMLKAYVKRLLT